MKRTRGLKIAIAAALALCATTACQTESGTTGARTADFPKSQFPEATFDSLKGQLQWYDTSGGSITEGKSDTIFKDFATLTGVQIRGQRSVGMAKFMAASEAGSVPWSVVEFSTIGDLLDAEKAGYLAPLDTSVVPVDKLEPSGHDKYAVYAQRYGIMLAWNTKKWPENGKHPTSLTDLYNTKDFPGKRCLYKGISAGGTLEAPLLASGVKPDALYPLDTTAAFAKMDTIKKDIVWWDNGDDSIRYLLDGECDMGVVWSGRAYAAITQQKAPIGISWNQALYSTSPLAITAKAPNPKAAQALLAMWILDQKGQQKYVAKTTYATPIVGLDYSSDIAPFVASGENAKNAIEEDGAYYAEHSKELTDKFNQWLVGG